jgi:hypothetical protein
MPAARRVSSVQSRAPHHLSFDALLWKAAISIEGCGKAKGCNDEKRFDADQDYLLD